MSFSSRVRRCSEEQVGMDPGQQVTDFLRLCIDEGLNDDDIIILARKHPPTLEQCDYDLDGRVERRLGKLRGETALAKPLFLDWADTTAQIDPLWCVEGLVEKGDNVSLTGAAKIGKSLLSLEMAACKASGSSFLGQEQTPGTVLYLDWENRPDIVRDRLRAMQFDVRDLSGLKYLTFPTTGPLDSPQGAELMVRQTLAIGAELVVIDTMQRATAGDENSSQTVRDLYRYFTTPLRVEDVAVVRLDHLGKSDHTAPRGSSGKGDDVDQGWVLTGRSDGLLSLRRRLSRTGRGLDKYVLRRGTSPLSHELVNDAEEDDGEDEGHGSAGEALVEKLDKLGLPNNVGRDRARAGLSQAGLRCSTDALSEAIKIRKLRP